MTTDDQPYPYEPLYRHLLRDREAGKVKDDDVAVLTGFDRRSVSRWKREGLSARVADQVAIHLGLTPDMIWDPPVSAVDSVGEPPEAAPAVTTLEDHRDRRLEAILAGHKLAWNLQFVKTIDVDWDAGEARQTRAELVGPEVVDDYASALAGGAVFPAGLGVLNDSGYVELLAGVHRANGYEQAGIPEMPIYLLAGDPGELVGFLISVEDNSTHGAALSLDEKLSNAIRMVDLGLSQAEAARRTGLHPMKVNAALKTRNSGAVIAGLGLSSQWRKLPASSQWRLATAAQGNTEVLAEAVTTAAGAKLVSRQVFELAALIGAAVKAGGTAEALQVIEDYEVSVNPETRAASRWGSGAGRGAAGTPVLQLREACRALAALDADLVIDSCLPGDAAITLELVKRTALHLARIGPRLEQKARAADSAGRALALAEARGA